MAKNPLLNKQALPGSYADYLTRGQNAHAAAGPNNFNAIIANNDKIANSPVYDDGKYNSDVVMYKGTTPGVSTPSASPATAQTPYEIWKEMYGKQAQLMPTQSYTDWLMAGGMAGAAQKQYDATVRSAETDYEKSKALYGANAERLGRAGLTGSGYTDYLTGAGFSAMQGAKVAAADTKALTEAQQRSDYESYLKGVRQTNAQLKAQADAENQQSYAQYLALGGEAKGVIDSMMQSGQDDAAIKAYIQQHYGNQFDSQLDGWITGAHSYNDPIIAETNAAKTEEAEAEALARVQAARDALLSGYASGTVVNQATAEAELARLGYTKEEIEKAVAGISNVVLNQELTRMKASTATVESIPTSAYIDDLKLTGQLNDNEAATLKQEAQKRRAELLKEKYDNIGDAEVYAYTQQLADLYESGDITREAYVERMGDIVEANIEWAKEQKEPVVALAEILDSIESSEQLKDIEGEMLETVANEVNIIRFSFDSDINEHPQVKLTVRVGDKVNNDAAQQNIRLNLDSLENVGGKDVTQESLGEGEVGQIKAYNGKLYIYNSWRGQGYWSGIINVTERTAGSPENAKLIYDILVKKYS